MLNKTLPDRSRGRCLPLPWLIAGMVWMAGAAFAEPLQALANYDIVWNSPSEDSRGSMPLGNGDVALNGWVETNGDLLFYISKNDAWSDNVGGSKGLPKVGRVRITLTPPLSTGAGYRQSLNLAEGDIEIQGGGADAGTQLKVWVDANRPVIHVGLDGDAPHGLVASFETTRPAPQRDLAADTLLAGQTNRVTWYYRNRNQTVPELKNRTFGATMSGTALFNLSDTKLHTDQPLRHGEITLVVLTTQAPTPEEWLAKLTQATATAAGVPSATAWREHEQWWHDFWRRSWIFLSGDADATNVTRGYVLQRFVSACASRGDYPVKFNGSLFTMDWHKADKIKGVATNYVMSADARDWGGQYWFQNTRPMYWPMLESGDFDLMQPLFKMFRAMLPENEREVRDFYHHDGAYFAETKPFYGGINRLRLDAPGKYTDFYYTPILELSAMMLDYFHYTGDDRFARETLLPIADAGVTFFDQHWPHKNGKLVLDPDNAIETFWKVHNPAPDIAGLRWVLPGLLALPTELTTGEQRARWRRFLNEIPALPAGETNGMNVLLPAEIYGPSHNFENPELYAVYPFRIFGLHKPDLDLAKATFAARRFKEDGCWRQSGIQAALLGDATTAQKNVSFVLQRQDPQCRFPAFWAHGSDYVPDEDNGGNGENALQLMLMQCEGRKIYLLPAWPKAWNASFKLHAPGNTTVEGDVCNGKIESLKVTPPGRKADVVLPGQ